MYAEEVREELSSGAEVPVQRTLPLTSLKGVSVAVVVDAVNLTRNRRLRRVKG
jgi:hypothetical protein